MAVPGLSSTASAEATMLVVGALALLAGHTWGLVVVVASHVPLVGHTWPSLVAYGPGGTAPGGDAGAGAIAVVIVTLLPTLALGALLLPRVVGHLLDGKSPRTKAFCVAGGSLLLAASLVLPAF